MTRKRHLRLWIMITLPMIVVCCTALYFLGPFRFQGARASCLPDAKAVIENRAHLEFPPSASNIDCGYILLQGSDAWAKFEMSPSDLDTFLASTYVTSVSEQPIPDQAHFHYNTWFVTEYLYGDGTFEDGRMYYQQFILIDTRNPQLYVVYFEAWFGD